ncbi:MAG: FmdB family zinc ribbon protein [Candidatus Ratteibacteria bacterium]
MPTYEYECVNCGYKFEKFQKMTDKPVSECPKCKGNVKRLIGFGSGIIIKGSTSSTSKNISSCSTCSATSCSSCGK